MLIFEDLQLRQGSFVLRADMAIAKGKITALIGPSGAGKSTLLAVIAGFQATETGRILWDDRDLTKMAPGARPISVLFQDNNLFPHLTIAQNVGLGVRPDLRLGSRDLDRVTRALVQVGLEGFGDRKPAALSGGQQSRAALARVLLADRPVVLLDEPFSALGPALKAGMLDLVRDTLAAEGRTLIMVTHDPADTTRIADEVVLIDDGLAMPPVATKDIFDHPPPALAAYLGSATE